MEKRVFFIVGALILGTMPFWLRDALMFPDIVYYICAVVLLLIGITSDKKKKEDE